MHKNRLLPLEQYQKILHERINKLSLILCNKETGESYFFKPQIKSMWHKDFIKAYADKRYYQLKNRLEKKDCKMITLTYSTEFYSKEQVANRHKSDIKKFFRELRKVYKNIQYCYFIELTKKLYIHFHIYVNQFISQPKIKEIWQKITGSYLVFIKQITSEKQISYCSSYHQIMTKFNDEQMKFAWKHISRFFSQSRNFFTKEEKTESLFYFLGRCKLIGINLLENMNLINYNKALLLKIDEIDNEIEGVFYHLVLNDIDKILYLKGEKIENYNQRE